MKGTIATNTSSFDDKNESVEALPKLLSFSDRRASFGDSPKLRKQKEGIDIVLATENTAGANPDKGEFDRVKKRLSKLK